MKTYLLPVVIVMLAACTATNPPVEEVIIANGVSFKMIQVEGGTFIMGTDDTVETYPRERPAHLVRVSSFYIGETEVTQELWSAVMGENPSFFKGDGQRPVEFVSWEECQEFIARLNEITGRRFSLPTEAEWEFAAIGGNKSKGYQYAGSDYPPEVGWIMDNSENKTHPVKQKKANELGIYDMTGNVWEWCQDWYDRDYYTYSPEENPQGPELDPDLPEDSIPCHTMRGGSYCSMAKRCRNTNRVGVEVEIGDIMYGLRLVLHTVQ